MPTRPEIIADALRTRLAEVEAHSSLASSNDPVTSDDDLEEVLRRLMVSDRVNVDRDSARVSSRLNCIAAYAAESEDLRILDALNYYFENHPEKMTEAMPVYAQALRLHIEKLCESVS